MKYQEPCIRSVMPVRQAVNELKRNNLLHLKTKATKTVRNRMRSNELIVGCPIVFYASYVFSLSPMEPQ